MFKRKANNRLASELFDRETPEEEIGNWIDRLRTDPNGGPRLARLLPESLPMYEGRGTNQVVRIRGYILAAFAQTGLPNSAIPYVLEDLYNSQNPYLVAAAAIAVRGMKDPTPQILPYLWEATYNLQFKDDSLSFECLRPEWPVSKPTSGLQEVFKTFGWLGGYARQAVPQLKEFLETPNSFESRILDEVQRAVIAIEADPSEIQSCCELPSGRHTGLGKAKQPGIQRMMEIGLEDQSGNKLRFKDFFLGRPTIVAFFYSRCDMPNKCSLTVTKFGQLQDRLTEQGLNDQVNLALVSYDPRWDTAARLSSYGENRGFTFSENSRAFRVDPERFDEFREFFQLEVNYTNTTVNQHRVELFILDKAGTLQTSFTRIQWDNDEVLESVREASQNAPEETNVTTDFVSSASAVLLSIVAVFFPKCPLCWASYLSVFGIASLETIPYSPWLYPTLVLAIGVNLWVLYRIARIRNGLIPFSFCVLGSVILLGLGIGMKIQPATYVGIALIIFGVVLNSLPYSMYVKLRSVVSNLVISLK